MDFIAYVRKPLQVEAIQVTEENMEELAPLVGSFRKKTNDDGSVTPFIKCDKRLIGNGVYKIWPGFWLTKLGDSIHAFTEPVYRSQFIEVTPDLDLNSFLRREDNVDPADSPS